jgi:hypothetical protein
MPHLLPRSFIQNADQEVLFKIDFALERNLEEPATLDYGGVAPRYMYSVFAALRKAVKNRDARNDNGGGNGNRSSGRQFKLIVVAEKEREKERVEREKVEISLFLDSRKKAEKGKKVNNGLSLTDKVVNNRNVQVGSTAAYTFTTQSQPQMHPQIQPSQPQIHPPIASDLPLDSAIAPDDLGINICSLTGLLQPAVEFLEQRVDLEEEASVFETEMGRLSKVLFSV